jgi:hypothetical protein
MEARRGNFVPFEEILGEGLASFELGGGAVRTEDREAAALELVDQAQDERELRPDDGQSDRKLLREVRELHDVRGLDGDRVRERADPGVAGSAEDLRYLGALAELPHEGVLPPSSADDENSHVGLSPELFESAEVKVNTVSKLALLVKLRDYPTVPSKESTESGIVKSV